MRPHPPRAFHARGRVVRLPSTVVERLDQGCPEGGAATLTPALEATLPRPPQARATVALASTIVAAPKLPLTASQTCFTVSKRSTPAYSHAGVTRGAVRRYRSERLRSKRPVVRALRGRSWDP